MGKDNQARKPLFFLKKQFWNVTAPPWQAPPYEGPIETHRAPYVIPTTGAVSLVLASCSAEANHFCRKCI